MTAAEYELWISRLRAAIGCPVDWSICHGSWHWHKTMRMYWAEIAKDEQAYNELDFYEQIYAAEMLDEEELRRIEINASYWRSRAVARYTSQVQLFQRLEFDDQDGKHQPRPRESRQQIIERSVKDALFFQEFDKEFLIDGVVWCFEEQWRTIISEKPDHLYVRLNKEIGASKGKPAAALRFDLDHFICTFHGHPILENEKPAEYQWFNELPELAEDPDRLDRPDIDEPLVYLSHLADCPAGWRRIGYGDR